MEKYLRKRTKTEFKTTNTLFQRLFKKWLSTWNEKQMHDDLYSLYVRLQILCILLRACLEYKMIKNIKIDTANKPKKLRDFCNFIIHRLSGNYGDNRTDTNFVKNNLKIYLKLDTDKRSSVSFNIIDAMLKIKKEIKKLKS